MITFVGTGEVRLYQLAQVLIKDQTQSLCIHNIHIFILKVKFFFLKIWFEREKKNSRKK